MEDDNSMTDRILRQIEDIVNNRQFIKEFTIVPTSDNTTNKSPVLFEELNLGLESWCIKHIYRHVCADLFEIREQLATKKLPYYKMANLNRMLIGALLINPDVPTFWNMKRELVECDILNAQKELQFSKIVLTSKSKSNEAFSYRRWLLTRILNKLSNNDMETPLNLLENEFEVANAASDRSQNNYHSWTHRIWCLGNIASKNSNFSNIVYNELDLNYSWVSTHVSEHTGYHYRQHLISLTKDNKKIHCIYNLFYNYVIMYLGAINEDCPKHFLHYLLGKQRNCKFVEETDNYVNYISLLLYDLFNTVNNLNDFYPDHETLWYHRRFLLYHLIQFSYEYHSLEMVKVDRKMNDHHCKMDVNIANTDLVAYFDVTNCTESGEKQPKLFKNQPNKVESSKLYDILVNSEKVYIAKNSASNCSSVQKQYAKRHQKWLKFVLGFDLD